MIMAAPDTRETSTAIIGFARSSLRAVTPTHE
jgi:hypothetical protein